jgi:hypothetical protein
MGDLTSLYEEEKTSERTVREIIRQRRAQMLIHSCIYYVLDDNIVSDHKWQAWAFELAKLQDENPSECKLNFFDEYFVGWTGATGGSHLPLKNGWVYRKAQWLLQHERNK